MNRHANPDELENLWADPAHADVIARLQARVKQWEEETKV